MLSLPDPFVPDEMAQHRTPAHCPMCLQRKPCPCDAKADVLEAAEMQVAVREESPPDPELGEAIEVLDRVIAPERWQERQDLE
jgi:hypothetical protein